MVGDNTSLVLSQDKTCVVLSQETSLLLSPKTSFVIVFADLVTLSLNVQPYRKMRQVETVSSADLEMFDVIFLSNGMVAVEEGVAETVKVLRDTASGHSLIMVASTINLAETAAFGTFLPFKGFGGAYCAVPLYKMFVRTKIFFLDMLRCEWCLNYH